MQDSINVRGDVTITLTGPGNQIEVREYKNLVVNNGKTILARLLGHDVAYINEYIDTIAFGTSGDAPVVTNTALGGEVLAKAATVSYPAYNSVMFSATMLDTEGGANTFQELGLKSSGTGILFSRLVIPSITKSSLYKIQVDWTISFQ